MVSKFSIATVEMDRNRSSEFKEGSESRGVNVPARLGLSVHRIRPGKSKVITEEIFRLIFRFRSRLPNCEFRSHRFN